MPFGWSANSSAILSAQVWRRRCQESGVTPLNRPIATIMSSAVSMETGFPKVRHEQKGILPVTRPSGGEDVRYTCRVVSNSRDAGITRSAIFTAGSLAGSREDHPPAENADAIVGGARQGIQSQLEKFAAADAEFSATSNISQLRKRAWDEKTSGNARRPRIAPRPDRPLNRLDVRVFQWLNPGRWVCAHSKGSE